MTPADEKATTARGVGPGWIVMGAARMLGGAFLAYAAMQYGATVEQAMDPTQMYLSAFWQITRDHGLAVWVTLVFVVFDPADMRWPARAMSTTCALANPRP